LGLGDILGAVTGNLSLRITSDWSPPIVIPLGGEDTEPGAGRAVLGLVKPRVEVINQDGAVLGSYAPGGVPSPPTDWLPLVGVVAAVGLVGALGVYGLVKVLR
jgi:hypothetical protein